MSMSDPQVEGVSSALKAAATKYLARRRKAILKKCGGDYPSPAAERTMKRSENEALRAVRHAAHVHRRLTSKRRAFERGTAALGTCSDRCASVLRRELGVEGGGGGSAAARKGKTGSQAKAALEAVLGHWFTHYIRLHDGLVLMQSGECRHAGDSTAAASAETAEFRSSFGKLSERGDGYTKLYSSGRGYSGYGWDEFYNEDVGVKRRLLDALLSFGGVPDARKTDERRNVAWENLGDAAEAFEDALDAHETALKAATGDLDEVQRKFVRDVNALLLELHNRRDDVSGRRRNGGGGGVGGAGGKIAMSTRDKFEKLQLLNAGALGIETIELTRRADDFVIRDEGGALPSGWSAARWAEAAELRYGGGGGDAAPAEVVAARGHKSAASARSSARKKRRVIEDSSDEDDEKPRASIKETKLAPKAVTESSSGLKVQAKMVAPSKKKTSAGTSLNAIKEALGVDAAKLREGREELEHEELESSAVACAEDAENAGFGKIEAVSDKAEDRERSTAIAAKLEDIIEERENVQLYKSRIAASTGDTIALWNDQEDLRIHMMVLGNHLLDLREKVSAAAGVSATKLSSCLEEAEGAFRGAVKVVKAQERLLPAMVTEGALTAEDVPAATRNVLLLRGRANTNAGIALVEQVLVGTTDDGGDKVRHRRKKLLEAITFLEEGARCAKAMRSLAAEASSAADVANAAADEFGTSELDAVDAVALESLSYQHHGVALWHLGKQKASIGKMKLSAGASEGDDDGADDGADDGGYRLDRAMEGGGRVVATTGVRVEMARVWIDFYGAALELVRRTMDAVEVTTQRQPRSSSEGKAAVERAGPFVEAAVWGYKRASKASDEISRLERLVPKRGTLQRSKAKYNVTSSAELISEMTEIERWWKARKSSLLVVQRSTLKPASAPSKPLSRGDLDPNASRVHEREPTTRITLGSARSEGVAGGDALSRSKTRKKKARGVQLSGDLMKLFDEQCQVDNGVGDHSDIPTPSKESLKIYRKWGDDLLPSEGKDCIASFNLIAYQVSCPDDLPEW